MLTSRISSLRSSRVPPYEPHLCTAGGELRGLDLLISLIWTTWFYLQPERLPDLVFPTAFVVPSSVPHSFPTQLRTWECSYPSSTGAFPTSISLSWEQLCNYTLFRSGSSSSIVLHLEQRTQSGHQFSKFSFTRRPCHTALYTPSESASCSDFIIAEQRKGLVDGWEDRWIGLTVDLWMVGWMDGEKSGRRVGSMSR